MENTENVGVTGCRWLLESQNLDSRLVMDKSPGMCELRDKIAPWEAWIPKMSRSGWSPPARRWQWFASSFNYTAGCQGFCGCFWRKTMQGMEIRFIYLGRHKPEAGGFCLDLKLIIRGVSSRGPAFSPTHWQPTAERPRKLGHRFAGDAGTSGANSCRATGLPAESAVKVRSRTSLRPVVAVPGKGNCWYPR